MKRCSSCGKNSRGFAQFPCPSCTADLVRCLYCRENRNRYVCSCGFEGP